MKKLLIALLLVITFIPLSLAATPSTQVNGASYQEWIDIFNNATWNYTVATGFSTSSNVAAVRWYTTEGSHGDTVLNNASGSCLGLSTASNYFAVVTDEHGNVQYSHSLGTNQTRFELLHNYTRLLYNPTRGNLPSWRSCIQGNATYDDYLDVRGANDSASDGDLRIGKSLSIACAKQRNGTWGNTSEGFLDYCSEWSTLMQNIADGDFTYVNNTWELCNGYNNAAGCPTVFQSFRPDYFEISVLMDYANYSGNSTYANMARDTIKLYNKSLGTNKIHQGKTGSFTADLSVYDCNELCSPAYMDNTDTWRVFPALGEAYAHHPTILSNFTTVITHWYYNFSYGNTSITPSASKPFEIYSNTTDGVIKQTDNTYKTTGMHLPLAAAFNMSMAQAQAEQFVNSVWSNTSHRPSNAAYAGAYYFQFVTRGFATTAGINNFSSYVVAASNSSNTSNQSNGTIQKQAVLADIRDLVHWDNSVQCLNESNFLYGSYEGCATSGNEESINIDYLCAAPYRAAWLGIHDSNASQIERAILAFNAANNYRSDRGGYAGGNVLGGITNPNSYFGGFCLMLTYELLEPHLNQTEKDAFNTSVQRFVSYNTWTPVEIIRNESGLASSVTKPYLNRQVRKQLNFSPSLANESNYDLYIKVRFTSKTGSPNVSKGIYLDGYIYNESYPLDPYPLERINGQGDSGFIWISFNQSYIEHCPQIGGIYQCNVTIGNVTEWNNTDTFQIPRQSGSSGYSWVTTNGGATWSLTSGEYVVRGVYYNYSAPNDKWDDLDHVINQMHGKGASFGLSLPIMGSTSPLYDPIRTGYEYIKTVVIGNQRNGIYSERNTFFSDDPNATSYGPYYGGYGQIYQHLNNFIMAVSRAHDANATFTAALDDAAYASQYLLYGTDLTRVGGFGTRALDGIEPETMRENLEPYVLAAIAMSDNSTAANKLKYYIQEYYQRYYPQSNHTQFKTFTIGYMGLPFLYDYFPENYTAASLPNENFTARTFDDLSDTKLIYLNTLNYSAYLSYGNSTPTGGTLAAIQRDGQWLASGTAADGSYEPAYPGGINLLWYTSECGSYMNTQTTKTINSATYPYTMTFSGEMRNTSQHICGVQYTSKYVFYDDLIIINSTATQNVSVALWAPQNITITNGTTTYAHQAFKFHNYSIIPFNFDVQFHELGLYTDQALYQDKINGTGNEFYYWISTTTRSDANFYSTVDLTIPVAVYVMSSDNNTNTSFGDGTTISELGVYNTSLYVKTIDTDNTIIEVIDKNITLETDFRIRSGTLTVNGSGIYLTNMVLYDSSGTNICNTYSSFSITTNDTYVKTSTYGSSYCASGQGGAPMDTRGGVAWAIVFGVFGVAIAGGFVKIQDLMRR